MVAVQLKERLFTTKRFLTLLARALERRDRKGWICPPYFLRRCLFLVWNSPSRLGWLGPPVSTSLVLGFQLHPTKLSF